MLWNTYCLVRLSLIYRGRAIPIVWKVFEHGRASIAYEDYQALLDQAAQLLFAYHLKVIFLADRGFADTELMRHLRQLHWHFRIRIKESFYIYRPKKRACQVKYIRLAVGQTQFWHDIAITHEPYGKVHLVSEGTQVVQEGKRRLVDSHGFRGSSYLEIGWAWIKRVLSRGETLRTE